MHENVDRQANLPGAVRTWLALSLALVLLATAVGCNSTASAEAEEAEEHHLPPHRPASFLQLLDELPERIADLRAPATADDGRTVDRDARRRRYDELFDIVRWIPELAAESGLQKREWDEVRRISQSLERALVASGQAAPLLDASSAVDQFVAQLASYREASQRDALR